MEQSTRYIIYAIVAIIVLGLVVWGGYYVYEHWGKKEGMCGKMPLKGM